MNKAFVKDDDTWQVPQIEIDSRDQDSDKVRFGATVNVQPAEGPEKIYRIVGIDEADAGLREALIPRSGDARYLMLDIRECTKNEIQIHPVSSLPGRSSERAKTGNQNPGSRIQDQSILPMVFTATAKFECRILCNYKINSDPMPAAP